MTGFTAQDVPDQHGKCILVTGANTGIGFAAARALAGRGARVLLGCRDEARAREAMARIMAEVPGADLGFVPLDQADLNSVARAADLVANEPRLDVLLGNAGVMYPPLTRTAQGHELQFGVNHLGCFALTARLLPKLAGTPGARAVITASLAHRRGTIPWDDLDATAGYNRGQRYSDSKLANLLFAVELDRRLRAAALPVTAIACHPGVAGTDLARHLGPLKALMPLVGLLLNTSEQGAWPALQAATDPAARGGAYYGPQGFQEMRGVSGLAKASAQAMDPDLGRRLWEVSVALTGVDPGI